MVVLACTALAAALAWLYDPPWLIDQTTGLRRWEEQDGRRFRWSGAHASFFVPSSVAGFDMPLSTTFSDRDNRPMMVTVSVDDSVAARVILTAPGWSRVRVALPPAGRRKVRRIDVRTSITREDNHGVRIGAPEFSPNMADKLLPSAGGGEAK